MALLVCKLPCSGGFGVLGVLFHDVQSTGRVWNLAFPLFNYSLRLRAAVHGVRSLGASGVHILGYRA